jgi:hypothetical protein
VTYRQIHTVGKVVGECLKYRPKISVCTFVVIVAGTVKYRWIKSVGKVVGECEIPTEYIRL